LASPKRGDWLLFVEGGEEREMGAGLGTWLRKRGAGGVASSAAHGAAEEGGLTGG
jgi:hypothetical protein